MSKQNWSKRLRVQSHLDVVYNIRNVVNNIVVTLYGDTGLLDLFS